jgi:hypothetical protein
MQGRRAAGAALTIGLAIASPASAAELDVRTGAVSVIRGQVSDVTLNVSASGPVACTTVRNDPARATVDTQYSIVSGRTVPSGRPAPALLFYSNGQLNLQGLLTCGVDWDGAPEPYRVQATVAVAPDTPAGSYRIPVSGRVTNPGLGGTAPVSDSQAGTMEVTVLNPPPGPARRRLSNPRENRTVNLLPVRGRVLVRYPRAPKLVRVREPVQVPVGTRVDTVGGFVDLVSDRDARGNPQTATFWNGRFGVDYSRAVVPGQGATRRASRPITELTLARACPAKARRSLIPGRRTVDAAARKRRKRRGVFGRGRGRFRTRGSFGAGTVRGTYWYSESRCNSTLFEVYRGIVRVRDFGLGRTLDLRRGQGYLAVPPDPRRGASVG